MNDGVKNKLHPKYITKMLLSGIPVQLAGFFVCVSNLGAHGTFGRLIFGMLWYGCGQGLPVIVPIAQSPCLDLKWAPCWVESIFDNLCPVNCCVAKKTMTQDSWVSSEQVPILELKWWKAGFWYCVWMPNVSTRAPFIVTVSETSIAFKIVRCTLDSPPEQTRHSHSPVIEKFHPTVTSRRACCVC